MPIWRNSYALQLIPSFAAKLEEVVAFRAIGLDPGVGTGTPEERALFVELTRNRLTPSAASFSASPQRALLGFILDAYRLFTPILSALALMVYAFLTFILIRRRTGEVAWVALTALLILILARIAAIAYLNVTVFKVLPGSYLTDIYAPALAFVAITLLEGVDRIAGQIRSRK